MIRIAYTPGANNLMSLLGITHEDVFVTINDRHRGLTVEGLSRIAAVHWFSEDRIVLVESTVTKRKNHKERGLVRLREVTVSLVLLLRPILPAGEITRQMRMADILKLVAKSFGHHIVCSPDSFPMTLYTGPWDGQTFAAGPLSPPGSQMFICGTFSRERRSAELVWAFDMDRYWPWHAQK
jgi:hypothetical protein